MGTAEKIKQAVGLWKKTLAEQREEVPPHLGFELALRTAAIESSLGQRTQAPGSSHEGLFQLSRTQTRTHLYEYMPHYLRVLEQARPALPALQAQPGRLTPRVLLQPSVFNATDIQVFLMMTTAYASHKTLQENPHYNALTATQKMAALYLWHNAPALSLAVMEGRNSRLSINALTKGRFRWIFRGNPGLYNAAGTARPTQIMERFLTLSDPFIRLCAPALTAARDAVAPRPTPPPRTRPSPSLQAASR